MTSKTYNEMRAECAHFWPDGYPISLKYNPTELISFSCDKSIADDSLDHIEPRGTAQDNTHWLPFVAKCEAHFGHRDLRYLDLGCAGGGLVPAAKALGAKGGAARAKSLSAKKRSEIAKKAAQKRWKK
ncbi:MAG: hypothetical protein ACT4OF_11535 [Caulobacteraceae bacterium]